jgi:hypothetical protein
MKRILTVVALLSVLSCFAQAQTFENFWHPRPNLAMLRGTNPTVIVGNSIFEFKPTAEIQMTEVTFGQNGAKTAASFLDAFGPALTMQHSTQDANGVNSAEWSLSVAFLASGTTTQAPVFVPELSLTVGVLNNLVQLGPAYALTQPDPNYSRWRIHLAVGINLTQN